LKIREKLEENHIDGVDDGFDLEDATVIEQNTGQVY
jgi:hypothetical protein